MKNAPLLVVTIITTAILLSVAGACDGGDGVPVTTPQVAEVQEVVAVDTMRPANPTPPSQKRTAATNTPIPTLTPARTATPVSQSRPGLGVTRHAVQTGLEEEGVSPTPTSTRTSGVTRLVPILPDILKETFTPVVIFAPSPTPVGGSVFDPCGITKISSDMSQEEIKKRIDCTRTPTSLTPAPTEYTTHTDIDALEERTHELINSARAEQGLTGVDLDEQARAIARAHSADMANHSFITNAVLVGSYEYCATWVHQSWIYDSYEAQVSVHIPRNWRTPEELALAVVDGWVNSTEGHRETILDPAFRKAGVGIAISDDGQIFFTQIFCETD